MTSGLLKVNLNTTIKLILGAKHYFKVIAFGSNPLNEASLLRKIYIYKTYCKFHKIHS